MATEQKFKKGDRVKVLPNTQLNERSINVGEKGVIVDYREDGAAFIINFKNDNGRYYHYGQELELVKPKRHPFNLERALAGDKVVTRDGREIKGLYMRGNGPSLGLRYPIKDSGGEVYTEEGIYQVDGNSPENDLFMASKPKKEKDGMESLSKLVKMAKAITLLKEIKGTMCQSKATEIETVINVLRS